MFAALSFLRSVGRFSSVPVSQIRTLRQLGPSAGKMPARNSRESGQTWRTKGSGRAGNSNLLGCRLYHVQFNNYLIFYYRFSARTVSVLLVWPSSSLPISPKQHLIKKLPAQVFYTLYSLHETKLYKFEKLTNIFMSFFNFHKYDKLVGHFAWASSPGMQKFFFVTKHKPSFINSIV